MKEDPALQPDGEDQQLTAWTPLGAVAFFIIFRDLLYQLCGVLFISNVLEEESYAFYVMLMFFLPEFAST